MAPRPLDAGKDTVFAIINKAARFGDESDRAKLLDALRPVAGDDPQALRRLCAGSRDAGAVTAELRVLDHTWDGIGRIVKEVLGGQSDCFLVPSRIAVELSVKLRRHLDIDVLDAPGIEVLLEESLNTISLLRPTESERETLLLTDLSDSLLRRLPIHARSDDTVGGAVGIYRETDWPIPAALAKDVVTVQPCRNPEARERQEKLVRPWSPTTQIETALRRTEPHVFRKEILNALTKLPTPSEEDDPAFVEQLREIRWLVADGVPVSPDDVLALSSRVDEQARVLLPGGEEHPAFVPVDALPIGIRRHAGFEYVKRHLLPDADASLDALAKMIDDAGLVGYLGAGDERLVDDLAVLARNGAKLALPGWPLLAAVLASPESDRKPVRGIVSSFSQLADTEHEIAAAHLDALAELAQAQGTLEGQAARRVYDHGFTTITGWPEDVRRKVLGGTRVPTVAGIWRAGREVVEEANGIARTHALDLGLAQTMHRQRSHNHVGGTAGASNGPNDGSSDPAPIVQNHNGFIDVDFAELERESAAEQRRFLAPWKGHVPEDLVVIYLGFIGRYPCVREVAEEWRPGASTDVDTLWNDLDQRMKPTRGGTGGPNPLRKEINGRRFRIRVNSGKCVSAIALSGDRFEAPLDDGSSGLIVGNLHTQPQRARSADGSQRKLLIEIQLRQMNHRDRPSTEEAPAMFRRLVETVATDCHHLFMSDAQDALKEILDDVIRPDQPTLKDTKLLLRDRLPAILAEMKFPSGSACREALQEYQQEEGALLHSRLSDAAKSRDDLKQRLWERIDAPVAAELLSSIRDRIEDLGYSADRVLFELFQNADDAYTQLHDVPQQVPFRVEDLGNRSGVRVAHWGRLINHLGANADDGYRLGRDRDLLNMLVMNLSEKPAERDLTGKFGLGFKSVHILSDGVGIASGFLALRTRGGFLPEPWPDGIDEAEKLRRDGRRATVIDVPFAAGTVNAGTRSLRAFRTAATWLPALARRIRRIEISGVDPVTVDCTVHNCPAAARST